MNPTSDSSASRRSPKSPGADLLDVLSSGEPPAFANDFEHRIIFWNKGAEQVMGRTAAQTLGRFCHDVFCGRDTFGNRFCAETCAVTTSLAQKEPVRRFEVTAGDRQVSQVLGFTILHFPDASGTGPIAVHILDQVTLRPEVAKEIERYRKLGPPPQKPRPDGARETREGRAEELSRREREVLRSIAAGLPNKEIAASLGISVATVRNHVQRILQKLGVHSKLEAVALAFNHGWV